MINISNCIKYLLIFAGIFLPTQLMLIFVFHLPNFFQFFYLFLMLAIPLCFFVPLKNIIKVQDKTLIILFLMMIFWSTISIVLNYDSLLDRGMAFTYYTKLYSKFWDRPEVALWAWGIMRPVLYLTFIVILTYFLSIKGYLKLFIKVLVILGIISAVYSVYQLIASPLDLPFDSIFSGHDGKEIYIAGKLRRVEGVFFEAGPHATYLSPVFCILFMQLFQKDATKLLFSKINTIIFTVLTGFILFFTFSPIGFLTLILLPFLALILNFDKVKLSKKLILNTSIIVISIPILILILSLIFNHLKENANVNFMIFEYMKEKIYVTLSGMDHPLVYLSADRRAVRNFVGMSLFKDHWLIGAGPNSAIYYFFKYAYFCNISGSTLLFLKLRDITAVLNTHIKILCDLGIVGFSFYLCILLHPFYLYYKMHKKLKNVLIVQGLLIGFLFFIMLSFFSGFYFLNPHFWMIYISLIMAIRGYI